MRHETTLMSSGSPRPHGRRLSNAFLAALTSAIGFLAFRVYFDTQIMAAGQIPSGMLQYDSFYSLSFARELLREGNWLLFRNPYGSLDAEPSLFNGLASLLALLHPLWARNLHTFDLSMGALFSALSGWFFGVWMSGISRHPEWSTRLWTQLAILGGGIGFVLAGTLASEAMDPRLVNGSFWGLSWVMNDIATWEILYHAVFWWGISRYCDGGRVGPLVATAALLFLHPFTMVIFCIFPVMHSILEGLRSRSLAGVRLPTLIPIAGIGAVGVVVYNLILPHVSQDAAFLASVYRATRFTVDAPTLVVFLFPSLAGVLLTWLVRERSPLSGDPACSLRNASLLAAFLLIGLDLGGLVTEAVVQPAHWLRVYPVAFLVGAAVLRPPSPDRRSRRALGVGLCALLAVALLDSALGVRTVARFVVAGNSPPAILDRDLFEVVQRLSSEPPDRGLLYLRSCGKPPPQASASLEYALGALTPVRTGFGHVFFSPGLGEQVARRIVCQDGDARVRDGLARGYIVLTDSALRPVITVPPDRSFGRFDLYDPRVQ